MRAAVWLTVALLSQGCVTTTVSRTLMIPLQPVEPAAVAPNAGMFAAAYGSVSALPVPINTHSAEAMRSDTGDQVAGVQPDLGGMFRVAEHVLVGGNLFASPTSTAVKATSGEIGLGDELLFGFRTRVGYAGELPNGLGLVATFGWGLDFLPYADTLSGSSTKVGLAAAVTGAATYRAGLARFYLGLGVASQPTLSRTTVTCAGCGSSVDYDWQIAVSAGVKVQVAPTAALHFGAAMPLVRDRVAWTPVFTAGFAFDFVKPHQTEEEEPPPPPPPPVFKPEYVPPPPPPL